MRLQDEAGLARILEMSGQRQPDRVLDARLIIGQPDPMHPVLIGPLARGNPVGVETFDHVKGQTGSLVCGIAGRRCLLLGGTNQVIGR